LVADFTAGDLETSFHTPERLMQHRLPACVLPLRDPLTPSNEAKR
jgi:hypothetical protein